MSTIKKKNLFSVTPLVESLSLSEFSPRRVYVKLENCHPSGSFKFRGISRTCQYALEKGYKKVIASSEGNAGLATAISARLLGLKCRIIVSGDAHKDVIHRMEREGAGVEVVGHIWDDAHEHALKLVNNSNAFYIHPFDHPVVWSGHSTIIDEVAEQLRTTPSLVISSCGGGGLATGLIEGMRRHCWKSVPLLVMETTGADTLNAAVRAGPPVRPVKVRLDSEAKGLGSTLICQRLADLYNESSPPIISRLVEDRDAVDACLKFADQHRMLVEPACGVSLAAVYKGLVRQLFAENKEMFGDGPVVVIICGGAAVTLDMLNQWKSMFGL